jgi:hypothetical protein
MEDPPVVIQTCYPADLDPLDETPRYLSRYLFNQTYKDPDSRRNQGLYRCYVRGMSECDLRETYDVRSDWGFGSRW